MLINNFKDPPVENRPRPFWFFNGDMEREEIRRQIREMKAKGLGGFFLCARQGLRVPYLSNRWFETCGYAVETAREEGLEVWLYDEYPYPSGMSGGEVTIRHPEAKQQILELISRDLEDGEELAESLGEGRLVAAFAYPAEDGPTDWGKPLDIAPFCGILQNQEIYQKTKGSVSYRHNFKRYFSYGPSKELRWKADGRSRVILAFSRELKDFKYYGSFLDPANTEAVQCFLDTTYEPYKTALGKDFGKTVKGMFGDETSFLGRWPWSPRFPGCFAEKYGYPLTENIGALLDASYPGAKRIRYHYFQCVHELLRDCYHKPLGEWCEKNGIKYVTEVPSVRMSNQMYSHVPGGDPCHDKLGYPFEKIVERDFHFPRQNPKIISAMARQFDRRDSLVEAFHSMGWTATLQEFKWQIDRLTLMGVSLHNFHAYYYTLNGITKHDAPPSQFLQNPYWEYYKTFADYCGRSSSFITETESSASIAILHPAISWCTWLRHPFHRFDYTGSDPEEQERGDRLINDYKFICKTLLFSQLDYDDLDSEVMAMGRVEKGIIAVGRARYSTLVVPPLSCIEEYAFKLIREFLEGGGRVIFAGLSPWESIDEGFDPAAAFEEAGWGTLSPEEYFGVPGRAEGIQKSDRLVLLRSPGGLEAGGAGPELARLVRAFAPPRAEAVFPEGHEEELSRNIISCRRQDRNSSFIMLASQNGLSADTKVVFHDCPEGSCFYEADPETGAVYPLNVEKSKVEKSGSEKSGGGLFDAVIDAPLSPWSARIFAASSVPAETEPGGSLLSAFTRPSPKTLRLRLDPDREMKVSIDGPNVYRLEDLSVSIDGGPAFPSKPNTFIEHLKESGALKAAHVKFADGFGIPQHLSINYPIKGAYRFEFTIDEEEGEELFASPDPAGEALKVLLLRDRMGIMGEHRIMINGRELPAGDFKALRIYDQNNIAADVSGFLKPGLNSVDINVTAAEDWHGLSDPLYLLGGFGVLKRKGKFVIAKPPAAARPNARAVEGYPFYSGKFSFETELELEDPGDCENFSIELPEQYRIYECVSLALNGHDLGVRSFSPYLWQGKTALLKKGGNRLKLTIANTLGNMLEGCYYDYDEKKTVFIR
jgi:hypothetical protein